AKVVGPAEVCSMMKQILFGLSLCAAALAGQDLLYGQKGQEPDKKPAAQKSEEPDKKAPTPLALPGHSAHGEIFNEGPRQKAYLMDGMPKIHFLVTSKNPLVQKFVEQG